MKVEINREQLILEAAEVEFLENGYQGSKTTAIAKKAGVTHAMLHYYYRTKENLFQMVFIKKVQLVSNSFQEKISDKLSFEDAIRSIVEFHFEFIQQNPKLVNFVYNEILSNKDNRKLLIEEIHPKLSVIYNKIDSIIEQELAKGTIRQTKTVDLIMNIAALNLVTFMAYPIMSEYFMGQNENILDERKESNVQFILNALRKN